MNVASEQAVEGRGRDPLERAERQEANDRESFRALDKLLEISKCIINAAYCSGEKVEKNKRCSKCKLKS